MNLPISALSAFTVVLLSACAAVNPNPNVGLRSVDLMMQSGNCAEAKRLAEPAANRGEPWAMYRMGMIKIDQRCPPPDYAGAIEWLEKAASYESKNPWEKGSEIAVGPSGFFNARVSSTYAAYAIAEIYVRSNRPGVAWLVLNRARMQYAAEEQDYVKLSEYISQIEAKVSPEAIKQWHDEAVKNSWKWSIYTQPATDVKRP